MKRMYGRICAPAQSVLFCVALCVVLSSPPPSLVACQPSSTRFIAFFASINQDSWQEQIMTYRVFEKVNILGDARVVVGCFLLVGQLVHWGKKRYWVPGREEGQQVRRQELRHIDALVTSV